MGCESSSINIIEENVRNKENNKKNEIKIFEQKNILKLLNKKEYY